MFGGKVLVVAVFDGKVLVVAVFDEKILVVAVFDGKVLDAVCGTARFGDGVLVVAVFGGRAIIVVYDTAVFGLRRLDKQLASCHVSSRPIRSLHFLIMFSNKFDRENLHSTRNK